jgi:hypothetical protein
MSEAIAPQVLELGEISALPDHHVLDVFESIKRGLVNPVEVGLMKIAEASPRLETFAHYRVAGWGSEGVREEQVVKFRTMHSPTKEGLEFEERLFQLEVPQKEVSRHRIQKKKMREWSLDETATVIFNTLKLQHFSVNTPIPYADLMNVALVGPARSMLATEIAIDGDNANDMWCRALEKLAGEEKVSDYKSMHMILGGIYYPAQASPATAYRGTRQLNNLNDYYSVARGILQWQDIEDLPPMARKYTEARLVYSTLKRTLSRNGAA